MSIITSLYGIADDKWVPYINPVLTKYQINTPRRLRYFLAQSLFETGMYRQWEENLRYTTAQRLVDVWPSRFSLTGSNGKANANDYVNDPEKLGNLVYANRNGNGDADSGDGFAFRGRGGFHLTGKTNYGMYSNDLYGDDRIVQQPDLVAQPVDAFMSAGWFWGRGYFNGLADNDNFTAATIKINGSSATVPQRLVVLNKLNAIAAFNSLGSP